MAGNAQTGGPLTNPSGGGAAATGLGRPLAIQSSEEHSMSDQEGQILDLDARNGDRDARNRDLDGPEW